MRRNSPLPQYELHTVAFFPGVQCRAGGESQPGLLEPGRWTSVSASVGMLVTRHALLIGLEEDGTWPLLSSFPKWHLRSSCDRHYRSLNWGNLGYDCRAEREYRKNHKSKLRKYGGRRGGKSVRAMGGGGYKETVFSRHSASHKYELMAVMAAHKTWANSSQTKSQRAEGRCAWSLTPDWEHFGNWELLREGESFLKLWPPVGWQSSGWSRTQEYLRSTHCPWWL